MPSQLDIEKAGKNLLTVLDKVKTDTDPEILDRYRKLFKKEVSIFKRSWAAAWLLMYYDKREIPARVFDKSFAKAKTDRGKKLFEQELTLKEDNSKSLFINIGRKRRFFPRDALALINTKTGVSREDIGLIRIFDNYSFVQVRDNKARGIIDALNGLNYKGRTLTVNYAKPKPEEDV
ncbi:MAG: DbpA RNA binding domain-containing protein [Treponema sp.]|jgi:hypothetical protein|nr:DbpA RNA binding domain-containing protein [Treponema sp.]